MTTDVNALTIDMLRFASSLILIGQPELAQNYEARAMYLRSNPVAEDVEETRAWVRLTLNGGAGGLSDMYVQREGGSVDRELNQEYCELLAKMTDFANGGETPASDLIRQMGNEMFSNGYTYFRQVEAPVRKGLFVRGKTMYEVMTAPGVTHLVEAKLLGGSVGYDPRGSRRDMQECQQAAHRLFLEGRSDDWVHYSSAQVIPGESLQNHK